MVQTYVITEIQTFQDQWKHLKDKISYMYDSTIQEECVYYLHLSQPGVSWSVIVGGWFGAFMQKLLTTFPQSTKIEPQH